VFNHDWFIQEPVIQDPSPPVALPLTVSPTDTETLTKEYGNALVYIKQLESKVDNYAKQLLATEHDISSGTKNFNIQFPNFLTFIFLVRDSFSTELNAGVIATMKEEFKELQNQLLSNLSTEMNANLSRSNNH
jgi:hypothetical protein